MHAKTTPEEEISWNTLQSDLRGVVAVGFAHRNVWILRRVGRFFDGSRGRFRGRAEMVTSGQPRFDLPFG
jgi:hypothetical protein